MPTIFLSPSTQQFNPYITGGNEELWMNRLADEMVPYLTSSGIQYTRNDPNGTAADAIRLSNQGNYDLHLGLHSNAAPPSQSGEYRGIFVYYYPGSAKGMRAARIIGNNLKKIYPIPDNVRIESNTTIGEVRLPKAPSVFLEIGYHDNADDATWVTNNLNLIAQNIASSLAQYFGIPFLYPVAPRNGVVDITSGYLNIRSRPNTSAAVIAKAYDGARLTVINQWNGWYLVRFDDVIGYASAQYIDIV